MAGVYVGLSRETGLVKLGEKVGIMSLCVFTDDTAIERDPWFKIGEGLRVGRLEDGRVSPSLFWYKTTALFEEGSWVVLRGWLLCWEGKGELLLALFSLLLCPGSLAELNQLMILLWAIEECGVEFQY